MKVQAVKTKLDDILPLRALFLAENNFQIRYNACHERHWTDSYLITLEGAPIGYAAIKGKYQLKERDAIFEFYVLPPYRKFSPLIFLKLLPSCRARFIECQSNEKHLTSMLYEFAQNITADVRLFADHFTTAMKQAEVTFRPAKKDDKIFKHGVEPVGSHVLALGEEVVATGGFLLHYNLPFADLYMEVKKKYRKRGLGSYLIQELKTACYKAGRIPAARCDISNPLSKATLEKAGMGICGYMLNGEIKKKR